MMRPFSLFGRAVTTTPVRGQRQQLRRLLCESLEQRALMAVLSVSNLQDSGPGSLREAILTANSNNEFDEIRFDLSGEGSNTIVLTSGELPITDSLDLFGPGSGNLIITSNNNSRLFNIQEQGFFEVFVNISGVTLTGGKADKGGAIRNEFASVTLRDVAVTGNSATVDGGGIYTIGEDFGSNTQTRFTLILEDSLVSGNTASGSGGGIFNEKDHVELYNTVVQNNTAALNGGGIYTWGNPVTIGEVGTLYVYDNSLIDNNDAGVNGGGIFAIDDHVDLRFSTVSNNSAGADGGGIYALATARDTNVVPQTLWVFRSSVSSNLAVNGSGGGIHINSDAFTLNSSTVELNQAATGGGIYLQNEFSNSIYAELFFSTVNNNVATADGGGIAVVGTVDLEGDGFNLNLDNSTVSGNRADVTGGGLFIGQLGSLDDVTLFATTIANNQAAQGGGIYSAGFGAGLTSTLVATNRAEIGPDLSGYFGLNRFESASESNLIGINNSDDSGLDPNVNLLGTAAAPIDPQLGPLQDNGGSTKTHALAENSPAIDASRFVSFFDQRQLRRSDNSEALGDIGAYERVLDFGDAPAPFPTLLADDGARHVVSALHLGALIDSEDNGRPSPVGFASGDDQNFNDDEDGVRFVFSNTAGFTGSAEILSSGAGLINAWIDVNGNGSWELNEQVLNDVAVVAGVNLLTFNLPNPPANAPQTFTAIARFRLSTQADLQPTGLAQDGEVEDYAMNITRVILPNGTNGGGYTFSERVPPRVRRSYDPSWPMATTTQ